MRHQPPAGAKEPLCGARCGGRRRRSPGATSPLPGGHHGTDAVGEGPQPDGQPSSSTRARRARDRRCAAAGELPRRGRARPFVERRAEARREAQASDRKVSDGRGEALLVKSCRRQLDAPPAWPGAAIRRSLPTAADLACERDQLGGAGAAAIDEHERCFLEMRRVARRSRLKAARSPAATAAARDRSSQSLRRPGSGFGSRCLGTRRRAITRFEPPAITSRGSLGMSAAATASTISSSRVARRAASRGTETKRRQTASGAANCSCRRAGVGTLITICADPSFVAQRLAPPVARRARTYARSDARFTYASMARSPPSRARVQRSGVAPRDAGTSAQIQHGTLGWRRARRRLGEADARPRARRSPARERPSSPPLR